MNIVTPYPTNIPINTANVTTESARRDNQLREMISKPTATEAGVAERGVASEHEKSKSPQQQQASVEVNLSKAEDHQKIGERGHGEGHQGQDQERQEKDKEREEAKKQLAEVESKLAKLDKQEIQELRSRDTEVKAHEQAHATVGGQYAGSPTYSFKRGPDGNNYAIGGEVAIDASAVPGDPRATIDKMRQVRAAALAPASPSGQDRKVAAQATQTANDARTQELKESATQEQEKADKAAAKAEEAQSAQGNAPDADPFNLFGDDEQSGPQTGNGNTLGDVFGVSGLPGGENSDQIQLNRQAAEQRNSDVVARAARVQNFYAASTKPREAGFSSFA